MSSQINTMKNYSQMFLWDFFYLLLLLYIYFWGGGCKGGICLPASVYLPPWLTSSSVALGGGQIGVSLPGDAAKEVEPLEIADVAEVGWGSGFQQYMESS